LYSSIYDDDVIRLEIKLEVYIAFACKLGGATGLNRIVKEC